MRNPSVAEELVQDVFMILLLNRKNVEEYENPYAFLVKVLRNRIGSEIQRAYRRYEEPLEERHESIPDKNTSPERLEDVLPDWLTKEERQILIWRIEYSLSFQEIAQQLNISEHACHARMYRLRGKFEKKRRKKENTP